MIETLSWVLPRPRKNWYPGGFPLWFEQKLVKLYNSPEKILHPFGGKAEYGIRLDIKPEVEPNVLGNAHDLPFKNNIFDMVIADPPYSSELSKKIYGTGKLNYKKWVAEAVRVCKPNGFIVVYHEKMLPRPDGTSYHKRIFLGVRIWHSLRCIGIFQKE